MLGWRNGVEGSHLRGFNTKDFWNVISQISYRRNWHPRLMDSGPSFKPRFGHLLLMPTSNWIFIMYSTVLLLTSGSGDIHSYRFVSLPGYCVSTTVQDACPLIGFLACFITDRAWRETRCAWQVSCQWQQSILLGGGGPSSCARCILLSY